MKLNIKNISIFFSAVAINLALIFPLYLNFLTLFYLAPIFYLALKKKLTFLNGFRWGLFFYSIHFLYLWILLLERGNNYIKYFVPIFLVAYFSTYSGIWFFLINIHNNAFWIITFTFIKEYLIYYWSLWIFQCCSGYVLTYSVLPLTINKQFRFWLAKIGIWGLTICLIVFAFLLAKKLSNKTFTKTDSFLILLLTISVLLTNTYDFKSSKLTNIGYIPLIEHNDLSPYDIGQIIMKEILKLMSSRPNLKLIVMPETSFPFALNMHKEIINWWYKKLQNKNLHIILGAHRKSGNKLYNTVYHLHKGKILNYYDKINLVSFAEYIPNFCASYLCLKNLFLKNIRCFSPGNNKNVDFKINSSTIKPCICSELYLNRYLNNSSDYIFIFTNESWFKIDYIKNLFLLFIISKKIELNKDILYISDSKLILVNDKFVFN